MKKLLEFGKKNLFSIVIASILLVFFVINYTTLFAKLENAPHATLYKAAYVIVLIVLATISFLIVKKVDKKENNYAKIFLLFAIVMGGFYLLLSPLFTGSDEPVHYYRIYEITNGNFATPVEDGVAGSQMPASLAETFEAASGHNDQVKYHHIRDMMRVPLDSEDTTLYSGHLAASFYSPISYIPQVVGFGIGKVVNAGPYFIGMLGRLFNLVFYILLGYFAIKIMPRGKLFYLLIFLSPNMLQLATTLSADAFTNAIFLLLLAVIMKTRLNNETVSYKHEILITILSIVISLCKISYAPLVALVLLIRKNQYKRGAKEKYLFAILVVGLSLLFTMLWMKSAGEILNLSSPNSELQKAFILSHPFSYLVIMLRAIVDTFVESAEALFVGSRMYHSQLIIPAIVSFAYVGLVVMASRKKEKVPKEKLTIFERNVVGLMCIAILVLILTALYMQATALVAGVGYPTIVGLQGRYFIPIVLCLPFVFEWKKTIEMNDKRIMACLVTISLIVWFYMLTQFII